MVVESVPIVVESTANEYFVLYVKHDLDGGEVELPVSVTLGEVGTTTLAENVEALPKERYRVEKYLIADPADVDGDCIDDITELGDLGNMNPVNPAAAIALSDGAVAVSDQDTFETLADDYHGRYVKFVLLDMDTDRPRVYFMNTAKYDRHRSFLDAVDINWDEDKLIVGVMTYHPELVASDGSLGVYRFHLHMLHYSFSLTARTYTLLAANMPLLEDNLALYLPNSFLLRMQSDLPLYRESRINLLFDEDILGETKFLELNPGEGYGLLRVMEPDDRPNPRDIVIYEALPNELPRVAGIISTVPQTPLSHVNLRAVQDGVPNSFIRDALDNTDIDDLIDSYVRYTVTKYEWTLRAATPAEVDAHYASSRPATEQTPQRDLSVTEISPLSEVGFEDWDAFGVKAANVAVLGTLGFPEGTVPDGFAVPFYFYDEFMKHNGFYDDIEEMLADPDFQTDFDVQEDELKDLRKAIKKGEMPEWITEELTNMHATYPDGQSLRYRSSTNNEDLPGFNGAGLYDSKTQHPEETEEDGIAKSLKQVYASLWNFRAFTERDFNRIDHLAAAMGVLVHPNYSDELANGVAVSFDPVRGYDGYYYVNTQLGEDLVTNPDAHSEPEEILLRDSGSHWVLATSNQVPPGQLLMSDDQMTQLRNHLEVVHEEFEGLYSPAPGERFAMEIEFKITSDNILAIKQARPWVFSEATAAVEPKPNRPATGQPTIEGTAQVGDTLTADISGIGDDDGLPAESEFDYQWIRNDGSTDANIAGATDSTYVLLAADVGKFIKVRVTFTDKNDYTETLTSAATAAVEAAAPAPGPITGFTVVDASDQSVEGTLADGGTLVLDDPVGGSFGIRADLESGATIGSMRLELTGAKTHEQTENIAPYSLYGDSGGNLSGESLPVGEYTLTATAYSEARLGGNALGTLNVSFSVTETATQQPNTPATGLPTISGTARVGETLRADISGIADVDGMSGAVFSYQWLANEVNIDTDIAGATDPTYTLVADDVGKAIRVRVSFMDGASNLETLISEATATVVTPLTAEFQDVPDKHDGTGFFTFLIAFSEPISISYKTLRDDSLEVTNGSATKAKRVNGQSDRWEITVEPDSDADVTVVLPITEDCAAQDAVCTRDGTKLSNRSELTVPGPAAANSPATGAPIISGTARVGETLTVDTSGIDDADGMSGAVFSYQWLADGVEITGATSDTYTLVDADFDKAVKVRVIFNDDDANEETLTSEATAAVAPRPNTPATGLPTISGTAQVGETLTADISGIGDDDGLDNATFSYQWIAGTTDIAGATDLTYTLVADDVGKAIRVRVSFDDDLNFLETLTSEATATVVTPLTAGFRDAPPSHNGSDTFTFRIAFSEPISIGYVTLRDDSLEVTNGSATKAKRVNGQSDLWEITVEPDSDADVTVVLPITEDCAAQDAVCTRDGTELSNRSELTVPGPAAANSPAMGAPIISGTAEVGETLTVDTSGIDDADGMSGAVFSYQWLANDAEITGATGDTYTLVEADFDKAVKVRVIFNDDDDNEETLTSEATASVAAETAVPDAPQSLNVSPDDTGTLDVSWEAPASDGGSAITGYKMQWKSGSEDYDGSAGSTRQAEITDPTSRTHTITGLTDGVEYAVRVIAVNDVGDGPPSDEATGTPRETTPPELATATVDGTTLTLTYDEDLDENSEPSSDAFSVTVGGTGRAVDGVSVSGSSVILTLASAVTAADTVTVSYAAPADTAAPRIQDEAGNPAASFSDQGVENNTPPPANSPATGAPTISGTAQVGETLTAETRDIEDDDGLDNAVFTYQWLANGADIAGATSDTYTLVETDVGKAIQVKVSFRDDKNNPETLTSAATAAVEPRPNSPATGAPTISGTVRVGETLTAGTSAIADADGMSGAVFIYQWLADDADIAGATNNTYTLVDADLDKAVKVRVIFTDNADNEETLTSAATAAVEPRPNSPATGAPTISGTAQVGETLTVDTSDIADADGMSGAVFSYQWLANGADVAGATSDTYTPVADDVGKAIKVKVSFRDDKNHQESLTSAATAAVTAADDSSIWSATLTVGSSGSFHGYWKDFMGSLAPDGFNIDGSDYTVTSLNRYGDLMFAFVLDQALPGDFTLQVGDTTLRSEEAEVTTSSSSYSYQWQNKIPDLSDGDIVEVSLTLAE